MFRPYNQVIIRTISKLSLQMLCLMESHLVHIRKNTKFLDDVETFRNLNLLERTMS